MEERPRFGQEQPEDDEEVSTSSSPRRIRSWKGSEGYWSRLLGEADSSRSEKANETEDEDEEEDDDDTTTKGWVKRYKKLKKSFSRSLLDVGASSSEQPQAQIHSENVEPTDSVGYYDTWSPTAVDNIIESAVPPVENTNDTLVASHEVTEQVKAPEIDTIETAEVPELGTPELVAAAAEQITEPVAEPESIETILQRRNIQNRLDRDDHDNQEVGGYTPPAKEALPAAQNKPEVVQKPAANVGLHLLNYALALRRDNKNKASAVKEFKRVDQDINKIRQTQKSAKDIYPTNIPEITLFKNQHVSQAEKHIDNTQLNVEQELRSVRNANIVEKTTNIYEKQSFEPIKTESIVRNIEQSTRQEIHQTTPERSLQDQEQFMQKVVEAVERKPSIESELAFERRHEVKDIQNDQPTEAKQGNMAYDDQPVNSGYNSYSHLNSENLERARSPESKSDDYKQAALSGAWGAVVGVIVFIAFYILTNG